MRTITWQQGDAYLSAHFQGLGGPCEVLIENTDQALAQLIAHTVAAEVWRIEDKFSRYRDDSLVARIHAHPDTKLTMDNESANLLDYAATCYQLSDGLFDISSGILGRAWNFQGAAHDSDAQPDSMMIQECLRSIGWPKVDWQRPHLRLPVGMQIDFGGIGKEYAVDRGTDIARQLISERGEKISAMVNLGGDLAVTGPRQNGAAAWQVGCQDDLPSAQRQPMLWQLRSGAIATSGSTRRYITYQGKRYGHILNPRNGWPVEGSPLSVSVAASTCSEAGFLSTLAMLQGDMAADFLHQQGVPFRLLSANGTVTSSSIDQVAPT